MRVPARGPAYVLELPADRVDARRFEALVHDARRTDGDARRALLEDALALWRGDALDGVPLGPVLAAEAGRRGSTRCV
ncbi:MAG TPA: BTAD domain-containing putative transcriptional regulator [Solirubrobacteraceae bacterium]|nr:BTAD domain-containing putative transcriptional regulator [Solirubrobacteraceae bacterium]